MFYVNFRNVFHHQLHNYPYRDNQKLVKQHPTLLSNLGRIVTLARFSVETAIHHIKRRYEVSSNIPWWICHHIGYILNYIAGIHTKFGIGSFEYVIFVFT